MSPTLIRRSLIVGALVAVAAVTSTQFVQAQVAATSKAKFTTEAFAKAQASGKPILIDVTAPWCPTCKAQAPVIQSLLAKPEFKNFVLLEIDFDTQKDALRSLNARQQSTLIVFKGKTETARSVGETGTGAIEILLGSAI